MRRNSLTEITPRSLSLHILLIVSLLTVLVFTGCTSSYNSQKYWHRTPASTGRNKCGCLMNPVKDRTVIFNHQDTYALQA